MQYQKTVMKKKKTKHYLVCNQVNLPVRLEEPYTAHSVNTKKNVYTGNKHSYTSKNKQT